MCLGVHFLNYHLDFVSETIDEGSDEDGECFLEDISTMLDCYLGKLFSDMTFDYY